jgi:hypothetical protein
LLALAAVGHTPCIGIVQTVLQCTVVAVIRSSKIQGFLQFYALIDVLTDGYSTNSSNLGSTSKVEVLEV